MKTCIIHGVAYREDELCQQCWPEGRPANEPDGWFASTCLTVGWVVSVVASGMSLINMVFVLYVLVLAGHGHLEEYGVPPPFFPRSVIVCILSGIVGFFWFAGLAIVFARARRNFRP